MDSGLGVVMADSIDVIASQLRDLKETMTQRFDDIDKRLDGLESQELHEADIKHTNRRIDDLKESTAKDIGDLKSSLWKAVSAAATIAGIVVALFEWALPLIMR